LLAVLILLSAFSPATQAMQALPDLQQRAMVTSVAGEVESTRSRYAIDVAIDPAVSIIAGTLSVDFVNTTGAPLSEIAFRLYPNASYYENGGLTIHELTVDGAPVQGILVSEATALIVPLSEALDVGGRSVVDLFFTTTIPSDSSGSFGIFSYVGESGAWLLADWYPIVAGWDEGGWRVEPPTPQGDPTFSDAAIYDVRLELPEGLEVVSTGNTVSRELRNGKALNRIVTGPAREFAMVVDDDFIVEKRVTGETTISVYTSSENDRFASATLDYATRALRTYASLYGLYSYSQLDLVGTDLTLALGVSWTGLIYIDAGSFDAELSGAGTDEWPFEFTIFHEVGHQWWGAQVGANSNDHMFLTEGLTNALAILAIADADGSDAAESLLRTRIVDPYLRLLNGLGDQVVDISVYDNPSAPPLSVLNYCKGALGFLAIREAIGAEAFGKAIADYSLDFRFKIAEPQDLRQAFERASGTSIDALWAHWFEEAATTMDEVESVFADFIE
jgi:hypothetical protein